MVVKTTEFFRQYYILHEEAIIHHDSRQITRSQVLLKLVRKLLKELACIFEFLKIGYHKSLTSQTLREFNKFIYVCISL